MSASGFSWKGASTHVWCKRSGEAGAHICNSRGTRGGGCVRHCGLWEDRAMPTGGVTKELFAGCESHRATSVSALRRLGVGTGALSPILMRLAFSLRHRHRLLMQIDPANRIPAASPATPSSILKRPYAHSALAGCDAVQGREGVAWARLLLGANKFSRKALGGSKFHTISAPLGLWLADRRATRCLSRVSSISGAAHERPPS